MKRKRHLRGKSVAIVGMNTAFVNQGEIFGFLGPNGAGKTSTINVMIGLARPSAGEIIIDFP